jgi:hypothetical protein
VTKNEKKEKREMQRSEFQLSLLPFVSEAALKLLICLHLSSSLPLG